MDRLVTRCFLGMCVSESCEFRKLVSRQRKFSRLITFLTLNLCQKQRSRGHYPPNLISEVVDQKRQTIFPSQNTETTPFKKGIKPDF